MAVYLLYQNNKNKVCRPGYIELLAVSTRPPEIYRAARSIVSALRASVNDLDLD